MKNALPELALLVVPRIQKVRDELSLFFVATVEPFLRGMRRTFKDEFIRDLVVPLVAVCLGLSVLCSVVWTKGMGNRSVSFVSVAYAGKPEVMKIPRRQHGKLHIKAKQDMKPEIVSVMVSLIAFLIFAALLLAMFWGNKGITFGVILVSLSAICALAVTAGQAAAILRPNMTVVFLLIVLSSFGLSAYSMRRFVDPSMMHKVSLTLLGECLIVYIISFIASFPYL